MLMPKVRAVPPFTAGQLESLSRSLGATEGGLTGSEIGKLLNQARIPDIDSTNTKWTRLYNALVTAQNKLQKGNCVLDFVFHALEPARHVESPGLFEARREEVNGVLAFRGLRFSADARFVSTRVARTLPEAKRRANALRERLRDREVHPDVLVFCKAELLEDNYFHAVFEASKSIMSKLRKKSGLDLDGMALIDATLGGSAPRLQINSLKPSPTRQNSAASSTWSRASGGHFGTPLLMRHGSSGRCQNRMPWICS